MQTQDDVRWRTVADLNTAADGSWSTTAPDGTYRIRFSQRGYLAQWYAGASTESAATLVVVNGSNRTGLNAALARAGTISGTVTGPAGPVTDAYVTVYREVAPGELGENVTTRGVDLLGLPRGAVLRLGPDAVVEVTGLRNPCVQIDGLGSGLMRELVTRDDDGRVVRRAGVMAVVLVGGRVAPGDEVGVELPEGEHEALQPV